MPSSLPDAADLVTIVREFAERELLPKAKDDLWFNLKVATNLLAMVERELRLGPGLDSAEAQRLAALFGGAGDRKEQIETLSQAIRSGEMDWRNPALVEHLRLVCAEALAVNNPKWTG